MAINMNADVGAMIKGLFSKKASQGEAKAPQNPYVKILISIVTVLILIALYIYFQTVAECPHKVTQRCCPYGAII